MQIEKIKTEEDKEGVGFLLLFIITGSAPERSMGLNPLVGSQGHPRALQFHPEHEARGTAGAKSRSSGRQGLDCSTTMASGLHPWAAPPPWLLDSTPRFLQRHPSPSRAFCSIELITHPACVSLGRVFSVSCGFSQIKFLEQLGWGPGRPLPALSSPCALERAQGKKQLQV